MSKFLTPPVWYDKYGNLNEMLTGSAGTSHDIAIGSSAEAGGGGIAIGGNAIDGGVAIGSGTTSWGPGCIAIGDGASTSAPNTIQLGNNDATYKLNVGNGRMSLNIGSTAESNWVSATSDGISQGLYLVRYGTYINTVYLMAPISVANPSEGGTITNDWYFPFNISPLKLTIGDGHPVVTNSYYLKVDKNSSASKLQITPGYYRNDSGSSSNTFVNMADGNSVMLFKIL